MNKDPKCIIFFHNPKTGGTFTRNVLNNVSKRNNLKVIIAEHKQDWINLVKNHPNALLFTNIRNPLTHIISLYSHGERGFLNVNRTYNFKTFDQFLCHLMHNRISQYIFFIRDNLYMCKIFDKNDKCFLDTLRMENLTTELQLYFDKHNIKYTYEDFKVDDNAYDTHPHMLVSKKYPQKLERINGKCVISAEIEIKIRDKYSLFFDHFNY